MTNLSRSRLVIAALLVLFILLTGLIASHYNFPYQAAAELTRSQIESSSLVRLDLGRPRPGKPFIINLDRANVGLSRSNETSWLIRAEKIRIRVNPLPLLIGQARGGLTAAAWESPISGRFTGRLYGQREFNFHFDRIDVPGFILEPLPFKGSLKGRLTGRVNIKGSPHVFPTGGQGSLRIASGHFAGQPVQGLPRFDTDFEQLTVDFEIEENSLILKRLHFKGAKIETTLTGRINNLTNPSLDLTGTAPFGLPGGPTRNLSFSLTGPAANPRLKLGSAN